MGRQGGVLRPRAWWVEQSCGEPTSFLVHHALEPLDDVDEAHQCGARAKRLPMRASGIAGPCLPRGDVAERPSLSPTPGSVTDGHVSPDTSLTGKHDTVTNPCGSGDADLRHD